jgi:uracil-DNA glycosylase family 4
MSNMRDYYLQNLGVGEIWKSRDVEVISRVVGGAVVVSDDHSNFEHHSPATVFPMQSITDLQGLQAQIQVCTQCDLCKSLGQGQLVHAARSIDVLVVTEFAAPSQMDAQEKLFNNILAALPIEKTFALYRSALLKAQFAESIEKELVQTAVKACSSFLRQEIDLLKPKFLLIFGELPLRTLIAPDVPIDPANLRQVPLYYQNIPIIATYSASTILEHPELKREVWMQLCRLKELIA